MRKIGYGLVGILFGVIVYLLMLTGIPISAEVKSTLAEFDIPRQEERFENLGGDIVPFNEDGTYHVSAGDFKSYEENGVVKYGKVNPMYYFIREPVVVPEPGQDDNPPLPGEPGIPNLPVIPGDNEVPGLGSEDPDKDVPEDVGPVYYKGFDIVSSRVVEGIDITNILETFKTYGKSPIEKQYYNVTSTYGLRQDPFLENTEAYHVGLDIGKAGIDKTNVYAAIHGEVVYVDYEEGGYGNYIILKHEGFDTLYAHMSYLPTHKVGDKVLAGDIIGKIGSTGRSTGPHLHFEVIKDNIRIDPEIFIKHLFK